MRVAVIATGVANLASVLAGLRRAGAEPEVTDDPAVVRAAPAAFLPGVGAFGAGLEGLRRTGCDAAVVERVREGRPLLAICLGLQMLARSSEETPGVEGLGLLDAHVTRFRGDVRVPHFGWNRVTPTPGARLLQPGYAYFANSYKLDGDLLGLPSKGSPGALRAGGWEGATSEHGGPFVAAIERGPVLACQFHPELSGDVGLGVLRRWLEVAC